MSEPPVVARPVADRPLPVLLRLLLVPWNLLANVACFTMFTWIVHDRRMPGWPDALDRAAHGPLWPVPGGFPARVLVNTLLFALFGLLHSGLARPPVARSLGRLLPRQVLRTFYLTVTAALWILILLFWQPLGVLVWDLRPALASLGVSARSVDTYGPLVPFAFVLLCLHTVVKHGPLRWAGLAQLVARGRQVDEVGELREGRGAEAREAHAPRLVTTGVYGVVRHPIYLYLLASILARPVLSLDLALFAACSVAFLVVALPHEEAKLVSLFGDAYRRYQRTTPAFIPFWPMPGDAGAPAQGR